MTKMIQIKDYQKQDGTKILFAKNKQEIYPLSMSEINYCEMEEKKKKLLSDLPRLLSYEPYSQTCSELLSSCICHILSPPPPHSPFSDISYSLLLEALFKPDNCQVFRDLIENYLFKYELN
jgi:hypothetical protein